MSMYDVLLLWQVTCFKGFGRVMVRLMVGQRWMKVGIWNRSWLLSCTCSCSLLKNNVIQSTVHIIYTVYFVLCWSITITYEGPVINYNQDVFPLCMKNSSDFLKLKATLLGWCICSLQSSLIHSPNQFADLLTPKLGFCSLMTGPSSDGLLP